MAAPSRMPNKEITRMCRYISGLLSYYGVMKLDELHRRGHLARQQLQDFRSRYRIELSGDVRRHGQAWRG